MPFRTIGPQGERTRLAYLVASLTPLALDEDDLLQNVLYQFRQRVSANADLQVQSTSD